MELYQRNGVWYCDARSLGLGRFSTKETNKALAKASALALIKQHQATQAVNKMKPKGITLDEAFDQALRTEWGDYSKPNTIMGHHKYVTEFFGGDRDLLDITQAEITKFKEFIIAQPKLKALSSQNKKLLHLSSLMRLAREQWGYTKVPKLSFNVKSPKTQRKFIYNLTQENALVLHFLSLGDTFMVDLICYLADTGVRLGEALKLRPEDIRMDSKVIDVWVSKGDEPRGIPMTDRVYRIVTKRKSFTDMKDYQVESAFRKARKHLGLPIDATLHGFRHTFATRMLEAGVDIQVVQNLMGHKSIATTLIYAKMTSKRKLDAMQAFQAMKVA